MRLTRSPDWKELHIKKVKKQQIKVLTALMYQNFANLTQALPHRYYTRDAPRVKNPGGPVVMRLTAAARQLICQNLGGPRPPRPPRLLHACT